MCYHSCSCHTFCKKSGTRLFFVSTLDIEYVIQDTIALTNIDAIHAKYNRTAKNATHKYISMMHNTTSKKVAQHATFFPRVILYNFLGFLGLGSLCKHNRITLGKNGVPSTVGPFAGRNCAFGVFITTQLHVKCIAT